MKVYRTIKDDTLDEIVFNHYGSVKGYIEKVLEFNRGLADYGDYFEAGIEIKLPDLKLEEEQKIITMWD